jgi:hypothetical protein
MGNCGLQIADCGLETMGWFDALVDDPRGQGKHHEQGQAGAGEMGGLQCGPSGRPHSSHRHAQHRDALLGLTDALADAKGLEGDLFDVEAETEVGQPGTRMLGNGSDDGAEHPPEEPKSGGGLLAGTDGGHAQRQQAQDKHARQAVDQDVLQSKARVPEEGPVRREQVA